MEASSLIERYRERYRSLSDKQQRWLIASLFMLLNAFIWLAIFHTLWYGDKHITDTPVYYDYAGRMARGLVPYRDFASEYPPVAMLLFSLPRLLSGSSYNLFVFWFEVEMMAFNLGIIALITAAASRLYRNQGSVAVSLGLYTLFLLSLGAIVQARFDIAVAFIIIASLTAFIFDRRLIAWTLLGVGLMTKIVPLLVGPLFFFIQLKRRQYRQLWLGPVVALIAAAVIALPFLIIAPSGLANSFLYHVDRPLQIESSWASLLLLAANHAGYEVSIMNSYGSHNVFASLSDTFATLSGPVTMIMFAVIFWLYWRRNTGVPGRESNLLLIRFAAITIIAFIVCGKVFSPQFLIWLLPLMPLAGSREQPWPAALFWVVLVLTQWEFPYHYWELYLVQPGMVAETAMRNLMLLVLLIALAVISRPKAEDARLP
jgi:uncharacterized membrane protein